MKKIIKLILISTLISSCSYLKKWQNNKVENAVKTQAKTIKVSEDFVQGSEDIPLLTGMKKIPDESLGFDSGSGSIMTSSYVSNFSENEIKDFYIKTLPQMGWNKKSDLENKISFVRESEKLEIEISKQDQKTITKFFIYSSIN